MTVKQFDNKVRSYRVKKGDLSKINKCAFTSIETNLVAHEIMPGNDTRRTCIYIEDGIAMISPEIHDKIHKDNKFDNYDFALVVLMKKYNCNYGKAELLYNEIYRISKNLYLKPFRVSWGFYTGKLVEGELIKIL